MQGQIIYLKKLTNQLSNYLFTRMNSWLCASNVAKMFR